MPRYEYKVIPAPKKAGKIKGVRGTDQKFAGSLAAIMNEQGAEGWEYQRTDTLPCEERQGLTGRTTTFQNMLIFRRKIEDTPEITAPVQPGEPVLAVPTFRATVADAAAPALAAATLDAPQGRAPAMGTAKAPEPAQAPGIAAQ